VIPAYLQVDDNSLKSTGSFADKSRVFKKFPRIKYQRVVRNTGDKYPYSLTTARSLFHFCSGEGTRNSERLMKLDPGAEAYLNPKDAQSLGLKEGDMIKITSEVGEIEVEVAIDELVGNRIVVLPYHFEKTLVNLLTPLKLDPESMTPCYKEIDVKIEKIK
jgi:predicted molibdopterin-dependent oxidoreductase YjgC